jgi:hypothetical protein
MDPSSMPEFSHPTQIDNRFFPLVPGTQWLYRGFVTEEGDQTPHSIVITVSSLTKQINGVSTRVVWERDLTFGELEESELAFFAQDDHGTVWNFGEYPEVFDGDTFEGASDTWITGLADARGGIHMLHDPDVGESYVEGRVPSIEFFDVSRIAAEGLEQRVPAGRFDHVVRIHETDPLDEAGGIQTKYYAPRVGLVRIGAIGGDSQERMTLRSYGMLDAASLEATNDEVRRLDRRGHRFSKIYARTAWVQ